MTGGSPMTYDLGHLHKRGGKGVAPWQSKKLEVGKTLGTEGKIMEKSWNMTHLYLEKVNHPGIMEKHGASVYTWKRKIIHKWGVPKMGDSPNHLKFSPFLNGETNGFGNPADPNFDNHKGLPRSADGFWRNLQDCKPSALFGVGGISIFGTESTSVLWSTSNFKESSGKEPAATLLGTHLVLHIAEWWGFLSFIVTTPFL